ncbi:Putative thymidylate synthase [Methanocaldococcus lauensis]|uniref:Putative thymidylate synthase n=1 Tax=Methanocaldococcus lauensis TaxID=2546128 RepID=A0A8D6PTF7_9EURY|nr:thymidylate synthase [Methanocaldococcus lauensis]CAB3289941.1 Putative thymidylate synthase [Methanocaldococcus lauensis]
MYIKKPSVALAYECLVKEILKNGKVIITEDGQRCKEILNVLVEITNPKLKTISSKYPFGKKAIESYTKQLLYGSESEGEFVYNYYERIREYPSYDKKLKNDQIDYVIKKLNSNPTSRRCVISLWNPFIDQKVKDVPCLNHITFTKRENNLYMTVVFRSNDILLAFHSNALGLIKLGELVAEKTNSELKRYTHFIVNAHIYIDRDKTEIEKYFPECLKYI